MTRPATRTRRRKWLMATGIVLVLAGVAGLGYVAWEYIGTNIVARQTQQNQLDDLHERWQSGEAAGSGEASAVLRIPRFGDDFEVPIIEGVSDDDLSAGVGHQPGTAGPGERGNFVLAGHRVTRGEPFADFPELRAGDRVEIETRTRTYEYRLDMDGDELEVDFSEGWVMESRPDYPAVADSRRLITLVTCAELFHTDGRLVAFGHLVDTRPTERTTATTAPS
ncbi:class E sortase [Solicola gregarius]|uniref:Class E sortase n=1 Tax=Solicola gregarius TaxID=2908642 RepID=A0AA46TEX4_9ACTN|nr:class E sortase [Solicola gregarius]UYM03933.1 class E sortase [Solicola gregarius]